MSKYNLIEYSDNLSNTSGNLWQYNKDEIANNANVTVENSSSFKYKSNYVGDTNDNGDLNGINIAAPLKYLNNFWRNAID